MRSLLYVPADNPRFIAGAAARGADAVILDLEDSVAPEAKVAAREALAASVPAVGAGGAEVLVRINAGASAEADALAAARAGAAGLIVPKAERAETFAALDAVLAPAEVGRAPMRFFALIESPAGVLDARSIARAPRVAGLLTGGEDLALALGGEPSPEVLHLPKLLVHYAARAEGLLSFGLLRSVAGFADLAGLEAAARQARAHGFDGATCVHPSAVPILNRAFLPSPEQIDWARRVLASGDAGGAARLGGDLIDAPVRARARAILDRAGREGEGLS